MSPFELIFAIANPLAMLGWVGPGALPRPENRGRRDQRRRDSRAALARLCRPGRCLLRRRRRRLRKHRCGPRPVPVRRAAGRRLAPLPRLRPLRRSVGGAHRAGRGHPASPRRSPAWRSPSCSGRSAFSPSSSSAPHTPGAPASRWRPDHVCPGAFRREPLALALRLSRRDRRGGTPASAAPLGRCRLPPPDDRADLRRLPPRRADGQRRQRLDQAAQVRGLAGPLSRHARLVLGLSVARDAEVPWPSHLRRRFGRADCLRDRLHRAPVGPRRRLAFQHRDADRGADVHADGRSLRRSSPRWRQSLASPSRGARARALRPRSASPWCSA